MLKKLACLALILTLALSAASCAKKADTKPVSTTAQVSEESGEVTTSASAENKEKSEKKSDKTKKATSKKTKDSKKKKSKTKKATSKQEKSEKKQKKEKKSKKAQPEKSSPKKSAPKKPSGKQSQTTTKKSVPTTKKKDSISVNITVDCTAAVGKVDGVPNYYLNNFEIDLKKGATAYSATKAACTKAGISLIATKTMYGEYISAIGSLAEKATSKYSGWTYTVNGNYPPRAADKYTLENGDTIKWIYKA